MVEETQQSVWNFDGAELFAIFDIKRRFMSNLDTWNLEGAYWDLRSLRREIDAKLKRKDRKIIEEFENENKKKQETTTEKQEIDKLISVVDSNKKEYDDSDKTNEDKSKFYLKLESAYMKLCFIMKKHGLYFREGEDSRLAVLRR